MSEQFFLLLRISKPEYNKTLYSEYKLFMNSQMAFQKKGLTQGQQDLFEGAITNLPCKILYSTDDRKNWRSLGDTTLIRKNNNAYIYCMYGLRFDEKYYNADNNKYHYVIPWEYIEPLWQGDETEMMIILNTPVFFSKFEHAAMKSNLSYGYGKVHYDLDYKMADENYFELAMTDPFESVFHKVKDGYEIQNEVRLCIICPDKPEHIELQLEENDQKLYIALIPLEYGKNILVELSDLEFDKEGKRPVRFSSKINFYESQ